MADSVIDLRKTGKNFAVLANKRCEEDVKGLPNNKLGKKFREQLQAVYSHVFGEDLPLGDEDFTFLLKFKNSRFEKIYYPSLVKGCAENSLASDPNSLYIRWGSNYKKLFAVETSKRNKVEISLFTQEGEEDSELDFSILPYAFNGDKYLDPSLCINFIDDEGDAFTYYFPIKIKPIESDPDSEAVDYTAVINTTMKRGLSALLDIILEAKEYKGLTPMLNESNLVERMCYAVKGYTVSLSKNNREIVKLHLANGEDMWCPYSFINYIKSGTALISEETPRLMVVEGSFTNISKKNGREYTNYRTAISDDSSKFNLENNPVGGIMTEDDAAEFYAETDENILSKFRYAQTLSDRDLDVDVDYLLVGYSVLEKKDGGSTYKLTVIDPRSQKQIVLWCPNSLIPTIKRAPVITSDNPSVFKVASKTTKGEKTYADSYIDLADGALEDSISLDFD